MRCSFCGDPAAHPATGCVYSPRVLACHACVVRFWTWFRRQMGKRWGGADFYAAAATSAQSCPPRTPNAS